MHTFRKNERLCGKIIIDNLFINGSSLKNSIFRLVWSPEGFDDDILAKTLIVVPKKNIKNAAKRNILKRRINKFDKKNRRPKKRLKNMLFQHTYEGGDSSAEIRCYQHLL